MNEPQPPLKTVNVLTVGMDSRKQAIFRMAFKMHTLHHYRLLDDLPGTPPHLAIFDFDSPDAHAAWQSFRTEYPALPTLIVTVEAPVAAPAPVLLKPIRVESLFPRLRHLLAGGEATSISPARSSEPSDKPVMADHSAKPGNTTPSPQVAGETQANPSRSTPAITTWPDTIEYFDPRKGLLGALLQARRTRTPSVISVAGRKALIVLPELDRAVPLQSEQQLREACLNDATAVTSQPLTAEDTANGEPTSLTGLLWQVALWASRGRLIAGFPEQAPVRLRHWPNLTRLAPAKNGMRIAAFWSRAPANLRLTVRMLGVPAEHVFSFLAASYSIGILDSSSLKSEPQAARKAVRQSSGEPIATPPADADPTQENAARQRSGFLSRLLKKVAGL